LIALSIALMAGLPVLGAAAQQQPMVKIKLVDNVEDPKIDGVWTSKTEWSDAGETIINYTDGTRLAIRGMHDNDFVYVMLEMPDDNEVDGHAAICFDTQGDGGTYLAEDDYCYVMGTTFREYHGNGRTTLMQQVPLDAYVVAQRGLSDSRSPMYSSKSHMTYEFRLPLDYLGSTDRTQFGFYVTYDTKGQSDNYTYYYSWPDYKSVDYLRTASPRSWGIAALSSDATTPEFPAPILGGALAGIVGTAVVVLMARTKLFATQQ
jgi:hypothetical protein